jgi:hypothetical protein
MLKADLRGRAFEVNIGPAALLKAITVPEARVGRAGRGRIFARF